MRCARLEGLPFGWVGIEKSCRGLARRSGAGVLMHVVASLDDGARDSHESVIAFALFS